MTAARIMIAIGFLMAMMMVNLAAKSVSYWPNAISSAIEIR